MKHKIVFWTDSFRLHTIRIFESFGKRNDVIVAYCKEEFRDIATYIPTNVQTVHITSKEDVTTLLNGTKEYLHINNALKVAPQFQLLKYAISELRKGKYEVISLFQEKYPYNGLLGILRSLKWFYTYRFGLGRNHKAIGYAGKQALISLKRAFLPGRIRLFEFNYATKFDNTIEEKLPSIPTFISVGAISPRKAIIESVSALKNTDSQFKLIIVGAGPQENHLAEIIKGDTRFEFLGKQSQGAIQKLFNSSDALILASHFDGWGCVVNEALSQGCRVIVSDGCGACSLIEDNNSIGERFADGDWNQLESIINREIANVKEHRLNRNQLKEFAAKIAPDTMANYLEACLTALKNNTQFPAPEWKKR